MSINPSNSCVIRVVESGNDSGLATNLELPLSPLKVSPRDKFLKNLMANTALALGTVPAECLAVRRILSLLENQPSIPLKPRFLFSNNVKQFQLSYVATIRAIGIQKLFSGSFSRLSYCLAGSFATLQGMDYFGPDSRGLFCTAVVKNAILPLSLLANARQSCLPLSKTFHFVAKSSVDPIVHTSFFLRNLLANSCLLPGFIVRDHFYEVMGKSDSKIPTILGLMVSSTTSTFMNSFLKPFFTGKYLIGARYSTAITFPALLPLLLREIASAGLIFANSSPRD